MAKSYEERGGTVRSEWRRAVMKTVALFALIKTASCSYSSPEQETPFNFPIDPTTTVSQPRIGGPTHTPEKTSGTYPPPKRNPTLRVCIGAFVDLVNNTIIVNPAVGNNQAMKGIPTPLMVHLQTEYGQRQAVVEPAQAYNPGTFRWYGADGVQRRQGPKKTDCGDVPVRITEVWQAGETEATIPALTSPAVQENSVHDLSTPDGLFGDTGECFYYRPYSYASDGDSLHALTRNLQSAVESTCLNTIKN